MGLGEAEKLRLLWGVPSHSREGALSLERGNSSTLAFPLPAQF